MHRTILFFAFVFLGVATSASAQVSFSFNQKDIEISAGQNFVEKNMETHRAVWADLGPIIIGGVAINHGKPDAAAIAALPLRVQIGRVRIDGGGWFGTKRVPSFGTKANFAARLRIAVTDRLALTWLHLSNASIGDANPASDIFGVTVKLR